MNSARTSPIRLRYSFSHHLLTIHEALDKCNRRVGRSVTGRFLLADEIDALVASVQDAVDASARPIDRYVRRWHWRQVLS